MAEQFREKLRQGLEVRGVNGEPIGTVENVSQNDFRVRRPNGPDILIPFGAISTVDNALVRLKVGAPEVDQQGWKTEPRRGTAGG